MAPPIRRSSAMCFTAGLPAKAINDVLEIVAACPLMIPSGRPSVPPACSTAAARSLRAPGIAAVATIRDWPVRSDDRYSSSGSSLARLADGGGGGGGGGGGAGGGASTELTCALAVGAIDEIAKTRTAARAT